MATESLSFRLAPPRPVNAHPAVDQHAVQFYEKDDFLLEGVARFVAAGISDGDSSIVSATQAHCTELDPDERLRAVAELQQRVAALEAEIGAKG